MKLKTGIILIYFLLPILAKAEDLNKYDIYVEKGNDFLYVNLSLKIGNSYSEKNYFLFSEVIEIDSIRINEIITDYHRNGDTLFFDEKMNIHNLKIQYKIPLQYFTDSQAIILRKEAKWYPYRRNELFQTSINVSDEDSFIIATGKLFGNNVFISEITDEIHLIFLPKHYYERTTIKKDEISLFHYYQHKNNPVKWTSHFKNEFIKSFTCFKAYFNDESTNNTLNIVEIYNNDFQMCQSLKGLILFGNIFYHIYLQNINTSWIPHEVAHQWWGNQLFFRQGKGRLFLEESITEYLKLKYVEDTYGNQSYKEMINIYTANEERITEKIPAIAIENVHTPNNSAIIYCKIPMLLDNMIKTNPQCDFNTIIQDVYHLYKGKYIIYDDFEGQIKSIEIKQAIIELTHF